MGIVKCGFIVRICSRGRGFACQCVTLAWTPPLPHMPSLFPTAAGSQSSSSSGCVADQEAHMVTVISPEGAANFSLLSDSDSTSRATSNPGCTPPTDPQSSGGDGQGSPPNGAEVTLGNGEPLAAAESGNQGLSETNCAAKLERLSLSARMDTESTVLGEVVPALFVFGGMDTKETVHSDAFIFVP